MRVCSVEVLLRKRRFFHFIYLNKSISSFWNYFIFDFQAFLRSPTTFFSNREFSLVYVRPQISILYVFGFHKRFSYRMTLIKSLMTTFFYIYWLFNWYKINWKRSRFDITLSNLFGIVYRTIILIAYEEN